MATYEKLDYGSDDGSQWGGASTDLLGMHGATPVDQAAAITSLAGTIGSSASSFGFNTSAEFNTFVTTVNSILTALREKGFIAS